MPDKLTNSTPPANVDLYYKERIGHPTESQQFTQEYLILSNVPFPRALQYKNAFNWIRSEWRIVEHGSGNGGESVRIAA